MAFWRVGEDEQPPEDFLRLLEEEDQGVDEIEQEEDCEWTDGDSGEEAEVESDEVVIHFSFVYNLLWL